MESNKNNNNNGADDHQDQQLRGSAQKCTLNELTNDEDKPAGGNKTNHEDRNDLLDLEICKTSVTMADLPTSAGLHRKLAAELNCQIFYCLNVATRRKFITGLGWDFYAMFRHSLLIKSKRLCNPVENGWRRSNGNVTVSEDGLIVSKNNNNNANRWQNVYAEKGFPTSVADCRMDDFPGTICYYYEVKSSGRYAIATISTDGRFGNCQFSALPVGAKSESNAQGNVFGCGLLMDPDNKVAIFFTLNGNLLDKEIIRIFHGIGLHLSSMETFGNK